MRFVFLFVNWLGFILYWVIVVFILSSVVSELFMFWLSVVVSGVVGWCIIVIVS